MATWFVVHTVTTTAANEEDVEQVAELLHGKQKQAWADSGYGGVQSRVDRQDFQWNIAARPSDMAKLPQGRAKRRRKQKEHGKASVRACVRACESGAPVRVVKRQFGLVRVRFGGLAKNTAHVVDPVRLVHLWRARKRLMAMMGVVPPESGMRQAKEAESRRIASENRHLSVQTSPTCQDH